MEKHVFDDLSRSLASASSRRSAMKAIAGGLSAVILGGRPALSQPAKAPLCHATGDPANPYVVVEVAEPAWDKHLAHGDTPYIDCCLDSDCTNGQVCVSGTCTTRCTNGGTFCPVNGLCYFHNCGPRASWNTATCRCECNAEYVSLPEGKCGVPCTSDADCSVVGGACTASEGGAGPNVCAHQSWSLYCSAPDFPCFTNDDCAPCDSTVCRADGKCVSQA